MSALGAHARALACHRNPPALSILGGSPSWGSSPFAIEVATKACTYSACSLGLLSRLWNYHATDEFLALKIDRHIVKQQQQ